MARIHISDDRRDSVLAPLFIVAYLFYEVSCSILLFDFCWRPEAVHGNRWFFKTPFFAPFCYLLSRSTQAFAVAKPVVFFIVLCLFLIPFFVGFVTAHVLQKIGNRERPVFGRARWRMWVLLAGWVFVPVPIEATLTVAFAV